MLPSLKLRLLPLSSTSTLVRRPASAWSAKSVYAQLPFHIQNLGLRSRTGGLLLYSTSSAGEIEDGVQPPEYLDEKEKAIFDKLKQELAPSSLEVQDISGGCGSMYAVNVTSERFRGLSMIKQHRLVNQVLGEQIRAWHGLQLRTKVPPTL